MDLNILNELLESELKEAADQVQLGRRRAMKSQLDTDEAGEESESNGKWTYTSPQGVKVSDLGKNNWEVEFEGETEKGDYETILKKAKAFSKLHYSRREAKLD